MTDFALVTVLFLLQWALMFGCFLLGVGYGKLRASG